MIVLDTETTGLDAKVHGVVAVAAHHVETGREISLIVRPADGLVMDPAAMAVHGISLERLNAEGLSEAEALRLFGVWLHVFGGDDWCGCNPAFDLAFMSALMTRTGVQVRLSRKPVCVQTLAWMAHTMGRISLRVGRDGLPSRSLDSILMALGKARTHDKHDALEDVRLTGWAFRELVRKISNGMARAMEPHNWRVRVEEMFPEIQCPAHWSQLEPGIRNAVMAGGRQ